MVDNSTGGDISHALQGQAVALFFLTHPGGQGLLNDPGSRAIQLCSQVVNFSCQWQRHVCSHYFRIHWVLQFNRIESYLIVMIDFEQHKVGM
jgi:hypothetical protein